VTTEAALAERIATAAAAGTPLAIVGGGTKRGMGRPAQSALEVSLAEHRGITLYEPAEMVIAARAGTPVAEIEVALAAKGQMLPFEPPDYRKLLGSSGEPTIGAVAAMNLSGPRRIQAGACRDALIGLRYINGRGEILRAGGRVMKNVTGLDVVKLQAGAWGTLGALTEVTFKLLPKPETEATVLLRGLDDAAGIVRLAEALGSPFEVSGACHVPAPLETKPVTAVRLEGFAASVAYRAEALVKRWREHGAADLLRDAASRPFWQDLRDLTLLAEPRELAIWRVSLKPGDAPRLVREIAAIGYGMRHLYDWGGGLVFMAVQARGDCGAAALREVLAPIGGHATLLRAPAELRAAIDVVEPLASGVARLNRQVKAALDPAGIFNPGRLRAGM
jgi:glycolate oxidase FAD binding subunit